MTAIEAIEKLLATEQSTTERDAAGIITPRGIDAAVRIRTIKECLSVARQTEEKYVQR